VVLVQRAAARASAPAAPMQVSASLDGLAAVWTRTQHAYTSVLSVLDARRRRVSITLSLVSKLKLVPDKLGL
jgi:hypothetical protein